MHHGISIGDKVLERVRQNALPILVITSIFGGVVAKMVCDGPRITREMHPGTHEYKALHLREAQDIQEGDMGPVDFIVRLMLGREKFKQDMVHAYQQAAARAEIPVTSEDLEEVRENN